MVRIYLDVETYRPQRDSALTGEKIIAIGFLRDETPYAESSLRENVESVFFSEWKEVSEKQVLMDSLKFVEQMLREHRFTVMVGFNILRYDIPLMITRAADYGVQVAAHSKTWCDTYTMDYLQMLLPANRNLFKGLRLDRICQKARELGLDPPESYGTAADVPEWYQSRHYDEIMHHNTQDLQRTRWLDLYGAKRLLAESVRQSQPLFRE